jgi:hypothetical protein
VCVWLCVFFGKKVESGRIEVSDGDSDGGFDDGHLLHRVIARIKVCADGVQNLDLCEGFEFK